MKAAIPAAGFGTRFLPATKSQPKEMLPIYDRPTLQYLIEEAVASGIDDILIITGRHKRSIEDHFDRSYELEYALQKAGKDRDLKKIRKITDLANISYVRQKNLKGLGDAIYASKKHVEDDAFAVLLGHTVTKSKTPCTSELMEAFEKYQTPTVALKKTEKNTLNRYKVLECEKIKSNICKITKITNRPQKENTKTNLSIMGRYILTPEIFDKINETEVGFNQEIHLTEAISKLDSVNGVIFKGKSYYIENRFEWLKTSIEYALEDMEFRDELVKYMKTYI